MIRSIIETVRRITRERSSPILVAIDGRSGSGKSTMARALAQEIPAAVVPGDDFFAAGIPARAWAARSAPERARDCVDWRRLRREALEPLLQGHDAAWYPFDFAAGMRPDGTYAISTERVRLEPAPVVLLDGAYSTRPELADLIDLSILITTPAATRLRRLEAREDPQFLAAWHDRWDAAEDYYFTHVRPPTAFDIVVDTHGAIR
jgi:para-aminobenzoate synthetase